MINKMPRHVNASFAVHSHIYFQYLICNMEIYFYLYLR